MISASDAADTLRLLVPGFLALKIFYVFGLRTRRSDLEWTLWSVLTAALIAALVDGVVAVVPSFADVRLALALVAGVVTGILLSAAWTAATRYVPWARARASRMAWDVILPEPHWVQVWTTDSKTISGKVAYVADPIESDDLDMYIVDPAWVDENRNVLPMTGVEGILIDRSNIAFVQVLSPESPDPV